MKIMALTAAGLIAVSALTPVSAEAQRRGWHDNRGWHGDRGWRGGWNRGWRGDGRWNRGWRGNRWGYAYRPRQRVVCNTVRGYYGPVRRCYNVWR